MKTKAADYLEADKDNKIPVVSDDDSPYTYLNIPFILGEMTQSFVKSRNAITDISFKTPWSDRLTL